MSPLSPYKGVAPRPRASSIIKEHRFSRVNLTTALSSKLPWGRFPSGTLSCSTVLLHRSQNLVEEYLNT